MVDKKGSDQSRRETPMKTAEELGTRILRVSEMMEDGLMQAALDLDFRHADRDPDTLWKGIEGLRRLPC
jgi:hypothetical protein